MKHLIIIILAAVLFCSQACPSNNSVNKENLAQSYRLYPTENMWTFLEVETFSGKIWQVQYSVKGDDYRFKTVLNEDSMIPKGDMAGQYAGRFELYKTQNMYNFILLDTSNGNTWQVQWSTEPESRMIMRIF